MKQQFYGLALIEVYSLEKCSQLMKLGDDFTIEKKE